MTALRAVHELGADLARYLRAALLAGDEALEVVPAARAAGDGRKLLLVQLNALRLGKRVPVRLTAAAPRSATYLRVMEPAMSIWSSNRTPSVEPSVPMIST